ncbi:hypothetical protein DTO271D3_6580 [Paecilomyces variotii]|nr:hypothetical protein DTO169E5_3952 [Paecilomyces variotii]KAJ9260980.1 hypothetical protein DTO207G8_130 [Paecilomyces variotii]KAJ9266938.1 hypothetical protein DTO195F2_873 [Paecilomyces variotii]KAJ9268734.1 hypothetical protein DTO212C5_5152 [Paecilomyces variotii]KAJ9313151.1 hypothetical protein DTO271D3_6580 [Paecilomyces variotii]
MELTDVKPSEITFKQHLFSSDFSVIFLVVIRNQTCVMKVVNIMDVVHDCLMRIVPQFYGSMDKFDPRPCQPHLNMFVEDEYPPSAILLEYLPNVEMIHLHNYTTERADRFIEGIKEIHKALIFHGDTKPRNMLLVKDDPDPDRVIWIDFDRADTYHEDQITERQRSFLREEEGIVVSFKHHMDEDVKKGKLVKAYLFYCT